MYKYGQTEQVTIKTDNRNTALKRSVLKYWELKPFLRDPNLALSFCHGSKHIVSCSVRVKVFYLINGSSRETNKSRIHTMMKQRCGLERNTVLRPTPGDPWGVEQHHWNTGAKENQQLNLGGTSNRQKRSGPNDLK